MQLIGILLIFLIPFFLIIQNSEILRKEKLILERLEFLEEKLDKISTLVNNVEYEVKD